MLLTPQDVEQFFKLHRTLMFFVNQRLKVVPDDIASPEAFAALSPQVRLKVRDALSANVDLIESFVADNPARLSEDELAIVRSWRHLVTGKFYVFRELKKYTVFLTTTDPAMQRCPAAPNAEPRIPSTVCSITASGMTTMWFLAPPSACTRLPVAAARS